MVSLADDATKVFVVRHPFTRLVSGYADKLAPKNKSNVIFDPITRKIAERYRPELKNETGRLTPTSLNTK